VFEKQFQASLVDCLDRPNEPDSPVLMAMGGRGTLYGIIHEDENKRRLSALKMEFENNKRIFESIYRHCEDNKTIRSKKRMKKFIRKVRSWTPLLQSSCT